MACCLAGEKGILDCKLCIHTSDKTNLCYYLELLIYFIKCHISLHLDKLYELALLGYA